MCGRINGAVTELVVSGGSAAGELAGGLRLSCGACHSAGPLVIPSLPFFSASKGLDVHALGGPDATLEVQAPVSSTQADGGYKDMRMHTYTQILVSSGLSGQ